MQGLPESSIREDVTEFRGQRVWIMPKSELASRGVNCGIVSCLSVCDNGKATGNPGDRGSTVRVYNSSNE